VLDAYGWPHDLTDEQILERLLALSLEPVARQDRMIPHSVTTAAIIQDEPPSA
jgi:hypothetical protein